MPATKGYRKRMRKLFSRRRARKGLSQYMVNYEIGEFVHININPVNMRTAPHKRYQGMTGKIIGKRGKALIVEVYLGNKKKQIITTKEHLTKYRAPAQVQVSSQAQAQ